METEYEKIKKYLMENFELFKNEVIKEFINYYGTQYENDIRTRIEDTNFIFYINPDSKDYMTDDRKKRKDSYKSLEKLYRKIQDEIKKSSNSNPQIYNYKSESSIAFYSSMMVNETCFLYMYSNGEHKLKREIFIPMFCADDVTIIHEMIHSIMSIPLVIVSSKHCDSLEYKTGLIASNHSGENYLEESITELEARIIRNRLKNRNISFIDNYYFYEFFQSFYNNFIPYTYRFYTFSKDKLNEARITLNKRKFINSIGKTNYDELISLIKDYYDNLYDCDKSYYDMYTNKIVNNMNKTIVLKLND